MMQSVYAARWLLHALALLLVICVVANQASWDVISIPAQTAVSRSASIGSRSNGTHMDDNAEQLTQPARVTFAPGSYCIIREHRSEHAVRECHEYAYLLNRADNGAESARRDTKSTTQVAIHAATERDIAKIQDTVDGDKELQTRNLDSVVASWCRIQPDGSWFVQGAQSMVCLVVLDTCLYTMVFWLLFGGLVTVLSLASCLWPTVLATLEPFTAFCSYVTALLGVFLAVEWWGYSTYFIDAAVLQSLSLSWHYGVAFKLVCVSVLLSLVAARITLHLAVRVRTNYAQLHTAPPASESSVTASPRGESPTAQRDECRGDTSDPLQCPPNYHV